MGLGKKSVVGHLPCQTNKQAVLVHIKKIIITVHYKVAVKIWTLF